jgi:succinate dehydrogenase / fumarate reductase membrane anchor subunit
MTNSRTPTAKVRGHGASGHGASHWIMQRISSVALFILIPPFVWMFSQSGAPDPVLTRAFLASPMGSVLTVLTLSATFLHMRLGLQVVIDDYISKATTKTMLLLANTLLTVGLWLVTVFCLIKLAF